MLKADLHPCYRSFRQSPDKTCRTNNLSRREASFDKLVTGNVIWKIFLNGLGFVIPRLARWCTRANDNAVQEGRFIEHHETPALGWGAAAVYVRMVAPIGSADKIISGNRHHNHRSDPGFQGAPDGVCAHAFSCTAHRGGTGFYCRRRSQNRREKFT